MIVTVNFEILQHAISPLLLVVQLAADVHGVLLRKYLCHQPGNIKQLSSLCKLLQRVLTIEMFPHPPWS
jgi:hypothetical protein